MQGKRDRISYGGYSTVELGRIILVCGHVMHYV